MNSQEIEQLLSFTTSENGILRDRAWDTSEADSYRRLLRELIRRTEGETGGSRSVATSWVSGSVVWASSSSNHEVQMVAESETYEYPDEFPEDPEDYCRIDSDSSLSVSENNEYQRST